MDSAGIRAALPGLLAALDAMRAIDVSGTEGYGIWAPDGTGPAASWAQALLGANQETDAMAYNAYRGRWDDLARAASQLAELI